jgi:hypothetical protein
MFSHLIFFKRKERWHPDSNWGMEALQASALPLGHATSMLQKHTYIPSACQRFSSKKIRTIIYFLKKETLLC